MKWSKPAVCELLDLLKSHSEYFPLSSVTQHNLTLFILHVKLKKKSNFYERIKKIKIITR